jgi:DNA polymerase
MSGLEIDFETRSDVNIKTAGAYLYFESPHTKALLASYKINGGPRRRWRYGQPCPADIREHVEAGGTISAHNAAFERLLWQKVLARIGWPLPTLEQFRCTAATAASMALPRDLGGLGAALNLPVKKNKDGAALIRFFSVPRRPKKDEPPGLYWHEPEDYPEKFEQFHDYCDDDVESESQADSRMVPLSEYEQDLYWLDQRINDRGIRIDIKSARTALRLAERAKVLLDRQMAELTAGAVTACSQVSKLVEWINGQGVPIPRPPKPKSKRCSSPTTCRPTSGRP